MRIAPFFTSLWFLLACCRGDTVRGPNEWQVIAQEDLKERLRSRYDTVFEDVGFIKACAQNRMDVYDVVDGRVQHFFRYEGGEIQGFEYEWTSDGAIWYVSNHVDGDLDREAIEFDYDRGLQYVRVYRNGDLISMDSLPLTERPLITLLSPPQTTVPAN